MYPDPEQIDKQMPLSVGYLAGVLMKAEVRSSKVACRCGVYQYLCNLVIEHSSSVGSYTSYLLLVKVDGQKMYKQ